MWTVHTKNRFLPQKNKNGGRFRIHEWDMREKFVNILRFFTSSHYNGSSSANFGGRPISGVQ